MSDHDKYHQQIVNASEDTRLRERLQSELTKETERPKRESPLEAIQRALGNDQLDNYNSHKWSSKQDPVSGDWDCYCVVCGIEDLGDPGEFDINYPVCDTETLIDLTTENDIDFS